MVAGVLVLALLAPAAPAHAGFGIVYPKGPDPAVREWPSWPDPVSCGGLPFDPVSVFAGPTEAEEGTGAPEAALRRFLEERLDPSAPTKYWREVTATPTRVEFAQGRLAQGPLWLAFELSEGEWKPGLPGYCVPRTVREGSEALHWTIDRSRRLGPSSRRIRVRLAGNGGCDGGRSLDAAAGAPEFHQRGRRLAITIWAEALPPGLYTCQKRIEPPLTVKLPGRLGERRLFDGSTYPPRPRG
jgi:hypothetical protein